MSDETRQQQIAQHVVQVARQIEELAQSDVPPERFFPAFLEQLAGVMSAPAALVWMREPSGQLRPAWQVGLDRLGLLDPQTRAAHEHLARQTVATGQARYHHRQQPADVQIPGDCGVILAPLYVGEHCVGAVQVIQRADAASQSYHGYLKFLEQLCGHASRYLTRSQADQPAAAEDSFLRQLAAFVDRLHRSLDVSEVAATAANDGRLLLGCDRLSVVQRRGRKTVVVAVSGQDQVHRRSNLVRAMRRLAAAAIRSNQTVTYAGTADELPPQLQKPLAEYLLESTSKMVMLLPLARPEPLAEPEPDPRKPLRQPKQHQAIGCLVVEQFSEGQPRPELAGRARLVAEHVATALSNAATLQRIPAARLLLALGRQLELLTTTRRLWLSAALAGFSLLLVALIVWPAEYRVTASGRLLPARRRAVFAPWEGRVIDVLVDDGATVEPGEKLLVIHNDQLHAELVAIRHELTERQQQLLAVRAQLARAMDAASRVEELRLQAELKKARIELDHLKVQLKILEQREERLTVRAPIAGVVTTFQLKQLLLNRPVQRGELLVELADPSGPWQLELLVREDRIGHVLRAQQRRSDPGLPVRFMLLSQPEVTYAGRVKSVATRPSVDERQGSVMRVVATPGGGRPPQAPVGAEVRARIDCGKRSLGYVLFGDVIDLFRRWLWL